MSIPSKLSRALKILLAAALTLLIAVWLLFLKLKPKPKVLKIGVMPDLDSIQIAVAVSFCENVELVLFTDAVSRSAAFRSGAVDLCVSDLLTATAEISSGRPDKILTATSGRYSVISKESDISNIESIGLSSGTVIEYTADRIFESKTIQKVYISSISARASAVLNGNVTAAVLPEPYATLSLSKELFIIAEQTEESVGIISCTESAYKKKQRQISDFLKAFDKAADVINNAPESDAIKQAMNTLSIGEAFVKVKLPIYRPATPPEKAVIDDVCSYLLENGICTPDKKAVSNALSN